KERLYEKVVSFLKLALKGPISFRSDIPVQGFKHIAGVKAVHPGILWLRAIVPCPVLQLIPDGEFNGLLGMLQVARVRRMGVHARKKPRAEDVGVVNPTCPFDRFAFWQWNIADANVLPRINP